MGILDIFGGGNDDVKTTTAPWKHQAPYLRFGFSEAERLYGKPPPSFFPGNTVAPFSPEQLSAMQLIAGRALAGAPEQFAARGQLVDTLSGGYLNPGNPYLSGVASNIWSQVGPRVAAMYSQAGRTPGGAGLYADTATRAFTDALAPYAFQNYAQERENQLRATALAPTIAGLDYADLGQLMGVGAMRQQQAQADINAARERHDFNQLRDWNQLGRFSQLIQGNYGGTTTQSGGPSATGTNILGGAALGAGIGNYFTTPGQAANPWTIGTGAALGGLLGLF